MKLCVNGQEVQVPFHLKDIADLLLHYQLNQRIVIVEWNGQMIKKEAYQTTKLKDGDQIELVHFVGGG